MLDFIVKSEEQKHKYLATQIRDILRTLDIVLNRQQKQINQAQDYHLNTQSGIEHIIKRDQYMTLEEAEWYGKNRSQTIQQLNAKQNDETRLRLIIKLRGLINEACMSYLTGEHLYQRQTGLKITNPLEVYTLLQKGQIYHYAADMMSGVSLEVRNILKDLGEPILLTKATEQLIRLIEEGMRFDDHDNITLKKLVSLLERCLDAMSILRKNAPQHLFYHQLEIMFNHTTEILSLNEHGNTKLND